MQAKPGQAALAHAKAASRYFFIKSIKAPIIPTKYILKEETLNNLRGRSQTTFTRQGR